MPSERAAKRGGPGDSLRDPNSEAALSDTAIS